ncbi:hypothetical protein BSL78_26914 [Apostichopus japonicus]|uniref:Uncharacterized protein n=1 Tax=Stichopus japonicus TaxID=307972 RepID=A0A2G8JKK0_STIJA|nr:hypothetical protein BSL78_26914 [Apostichopus japonicus]
MPLRSGILGLLRTRHTGLRQFRKIPGHVAALRCVALHRSQTNLRRTRTRVLGETPDQFMRETNAVGPQMHRPAYRTSFFRLCVAALTNSHRPYRARLTPDPRDGTAGPRAGRIKSGRHPSDGTGSPRPVSDFTHTGPEEPLLDRTGPGCLRDSGLGGLLRTRRPPRRLRGRSVLPKLTRKRRWDRGVPPYQLTLSRRPRAVLFNNWGLKTLRWGPLPQIIVKTAILERNARGRFHLYPCGPTLF